jgi:hypothetical protein
VPAAALAVAAIISVALADCSGWSPTGFGLSDADTPAPGRETDVERLTEQQKPRLVSVIVVLVEDPATIVTDVGVDEIS